MPPAVHGATDVYSTGSLLTTAETTTIHGSRRQQRSVVKVQQTMRDTGGFRVDVTVWFRHKNEVLYYVDSASRVHGPMDQRHTARLGAMQHTAVPVAGQGEQMSLERTSEEDNMWKINNSDYLNRSTTITTKETGRSKRRTMSADHSSLELDRLLSELHNVGRDFKRSSGATWGSQDVRRSQQKYSTTLTRQHFGGKDPVTVNIESSDRERLLMNELLEARKELLTLQRSRSLAENEMTSNCNHRIFESRRTKPANHESRSMSQSNIRQSDSNITSLFDRRRGGKGAYSAHRERMEVKTVEQPTEVYEEIETITLQPIGSGVQDLTSTVTHHNVTTMQKNMRSSTPSVNHLTASRSGQLRPTTPGFDGHSSTMHSQRRFISQTSPVGMPPTSPFHRQGSAYEINHHHQSQQQHHHQQQQHHHQTTEIRQRYSTGSAPGNGPVTTGYQPPVSPGIHSFGHSRTNSVISSGDGGLFAGHNATSGGLQDASSVLRAVQETSKIWYQPFITRDEAISILLDLPPGSFIVRDSNTFPDAFGLAVRVAAGPRKSSKSNIRKYLDGMMKKLTKDEHGQSKHDHEDDKMDKTELVRHYLIEPVNPRGVRLKHFSNEPIFPTLAALITQHTLQPIALPCRLMLPDMNSPHPTLQQHLLQQQNSNTSAGGGGASLSVPHTRDGAVTPGAGSQGRSAVVTTTMTSMSEHHQTSGGLNQVPPSPVPGPASSVLFIGGIDVESMSGSNAISRAVDEVFKLPEDAVKLSHCQLKVSANEGLSLTDIGRKYFFRRHFPPNQLSYCGLDPKDRRYSVPDELSRGITNARIFGFIAKKQGSDRDNTCYIMCELDPSQPAQNIIKLMTRSLGVARQ